MPCRNSSRAGMRAPSPSVISPAMDGPISCSMPEAPSTCWPSFPVARGRRRSHLHPAAMTCPAVEDTSRARPLLQADFDGDGRLDIAFSAVCGGSGAAVFFQNGDGTFTERLIQEAGCQLRRSAPGGRRERRWQAGPHRHRGSADHLVGGTCRCVRIAYGPHIRAGRDPVGGVGTIHVRRSIGAAGDYDGDGDTDILMSSPNGLFLFRQTAGALSPGYRVGSTLRATWADPLAVDFDFWIEEMCLMDVDGDGRLDVVERTIRGGGLLSTLGSAAEPGRRTAGATGPVCRGWLRLCRHAARRDR